MRKLFAIFLAVLFVMALVPMAAFASDAPADPSDEPVITTDEPAGPTDKPAEHGDDVPFIYRIALVLLAVGGGVVVGVGLVFYRIKRLHNYLIP